MTIKSSGRISIQDIVNEFGGAAPHKLSEYYRGGGLVPNTAVNSRIPTSGQIKLSDFYGASNFQAFSQAWSAPGTYNVTVPQGCTSITINEMQGAGGGGGGGGGADEDNVNSAGGGGGGGGAGTRIVGGTYAVTPGANLAIIVGAGGGGGVGTDEEGKAGGFTKYTAPWFAIVNGASGGASQVSVAIGAITAGGGGGGGVGGYSWSSTYRGTGGGGGSPGGSPGTGAVEVYTGGVLGQTLKVMGGGGGAGQASAYSAGGAGAPVSSAGYGSAGGLGAGGGGGGGGANDYINTEYGGTGGNGGNGYVYLTFNP